MRTRQTICAAIGIVATSGVALAAASINPIFPPWDGGPCKYVDTPGVATIVSVESADPDALNCTNDPVEVIFDYQPDDPASADLAVTGRRLKISEGVNPPREWVESEGLIVGSQHVCIRRDITSGTCTPLLFEFADVDYEAGIDLCYADTTFAMTVFPLEVTNAIYGQRIVILVEVEDYGFHPVAEPVHIIASSTSATIEIEPEDIWPGQVCEITAIPQPRPVIRPYREFPPGNEVMVKVCGQRDGFEQSREISINVLPGEDQVTEAASAVRDRFIPYLSENYPEFGITAETEWTPTIVKPYFLVVTHYLFFNDQWELGVMWHNTIPPYDWAKIYLRHRYTHMLPQYAFKIDSMSTEPPQVPHPIAPPEEVDR